MTNISQSSYLQDGGKNQLAWIWNKITSPSPYAFGPATQRYAQAPTFRYFYRCKSLFSLSIPFLNCSFLSPAPLILSMPLFFREAAPLGCLWKRCYLYLQCQLRVSVVEKYFGVFFSLTIKVSVE